MNKLQMNNSKPWSFSEGERRARRDLVRKIPRSEKFNIVRKTFRGKDLVG